MHFLEIGNFLYLFFFFHKFLCIFRNSKTIQGIWMTPTSLAQGNGPSGSGEIGFQRGFTISDFISDFGKVPFPSHLGKYIRKTGKISTKIHEFGKIKAIFGLGMTPI